MKYRNWKKSVLSIITCFALMCNLYPAAVFAEAGTAAVDTWDAFVTALADPAVTTITLSGDITSPQASGDDAVVIGSSDRAVTITGHRITLTGAGIILGGDVTFRNIELYFANAVRNAIIANGHSLTLDGVSNTASNNISLFCGGVTDYCGENAAEIPTAGTDGRITVMGANTLGNIYAGSLSDVVDGAADSPNDYTGSATITIASGASGMGNIYAHGAREDRSGGHGNVMRNDADLYQVSGNVTVQLSGSTLASIDGLTGGENNAAVIFSGGENRISGISFADIASLTVSSGVLQPAALNEGANLTVAAGTELDLSAVIEDKSTFTVGNFAGGGLLSVGSLDALKITGTISGETEFQTTDYRPMDQSTSGMVEDDFPYIDVTEAEGEGSFSFTPYSAQSAYTFVKINGVWTTVPGDAVVKPLNFGIEETEVSATAAELVEGGLEIPVSCRLTDEENEDFRYVPLAISISKDGADAIAATEDAYGYPAVPELGFGSICGDYTGEYDGNEYEKILRFYFVEPISAGTYTISLSVTLSDGSTVTDSFTLNVTAEEEAWYEIDSVDDLYAFAAEVNGGNTTLNGKLTADIVVNPGVFDAEGNYLPQSGEEVRVWTPIGNSSNRYEGTFEGGERAIVGLYCNDSGADYMGLFGYVVTGGKVQNVKVMNAFIKGKDRVGGVVGYHLGGTVTNCLNAGAVSGDGTAIGGVVGMNGGTVTDCWNAGTVSGSTNVGGVVGYHTGTITGSQNSGAVSGSTYVGGVVGTNTNTITNCYSTGDVTGTDNSVGGVAGDSIGSISNCYQIGTVSGSTNVGGVLGSNRNSGTVTNCYYRTGCAEDGSGTKQFGIGNAAQGSTTEDVEGVSAGYADFSTGEVAYLLQGEQNEQIWGQKIGTQASPVLGGEKVYYGHVSCVSGEIYTNNSAAGSTKPDHRYDNGICGDCDVCQSAVDSDSDGVYEITNAGQLCWFASQVNGGNTAMSAVLTADIALNPGTFDASNYTPVNGEEPRLWTPIGNSETPYVGTFEGNEKTVSGLYCNDGGADYVGLFGSVGAGGKVQNVKVANGRLGGHRGVGGVAGNNGGTVTNCRNAATVECGGDSQDVGGVVGHNSGSLTACCNAGLVQSGRDYVGGVVGNNSGTVANCFNAYYVYGYNHVGGVVGSNNGGIVMNCYNIGYIDGSGVSGGVAGSGNGGVTNCYYLSGCIESGNRTDLGIGSTTEDVEGWAEGKTNAQFASGEVAYLLQGEQSEQIWGQDITTGENDSERDAYPVLGGEKVYRGFTTCHADQSGAIYTNSPATAEKPEHSPAFSVNGAAMTASCAVCLAELGTARISAESKTYDGEEVTASVSGTGTLAETEFTVVYQCSGVELDGAPMLTGTYTASFTHEGVTASVEFTIEKAEPVYTAPTAEALVYNGSEQDLIKEGSTDHGEMLYSREKDGEYSAIIPTAADAGEYTVWYKVEGDANHNDSEPKSLAVTIAPLDIGDSKVTLLDAVLTYNGAAQSPTIASVEANGHLVSESWYSVTGNEGTNVGTYTLTLTACGENYTGSVTKEWSIEARTVTAPVFEGLQGEYSYTGEAVELSFTLKDDLGNVIDADEYSVAYSNNTAAGATATITITDREGGNYTVSGSAKFKIHAHTWSYTATGDLITATCEGAADVCGESREIRILDPKNTVYDGTEKTVIIEGSIDGVEIPAPVYSGDRRNVGTCGVELTLGGVTASMSFVITPAQLTVTADGKSKVYGEENPALTYQVSGLYGDDTLSGALKTTATATSAVGEYAIDCGTLANSNYTIVYKDAMLRITARTVTEPVFGGLLEKYSYTGEAVKPAFILVDDLGHEIDANEYSVAYSNNTAVGTATVTITDREGGNYTVSGSATFEIEGSTCMQDYAVMVDGSSAVVEVTVKGLMGGEAKLWVAQYRGGQLTAVRVVSVTADGTFETTAFDHTEGCSYKAFLMDAVSGAPLCAAAR